MSLNSVCDNHGHDDGFPDADLRAHVLAAAMRAAERELVAHGYTAFDRSAEVLHVALEDVLDEPDEEVRLAQPRRSRRAQNTPPVPPSTT